MSKYDIAPQDAGPIVIGGIGGSGTRLITQILQQEGVFFGGELNESLDNMWFSLLFVRRTIFLKPLEQIRCLAWLFINAMRGGQPIPDELLFLLDEAARYDRGPALTKGALEAARDSITSTQPLRNSSQFWGWKQPNTHVLVPLLARHFTRMKYIYVLRNGLDMAFSYNQNQLKYFWGDLLLEGDLDPTPRNSLRYWIASYNRIIGARELLGDRLYILDFDRLCKEPIEQIKQLNNFLNLDVSEDRVETLSHGITVPRSTGRYKQYDCGELCPGDVEFVRNLGFKTPELV